MKYAVGSLIDKPSIVAYNKIVRHEDRRKELGKVLMDIAKYLATVGLISGFLTNTLTVLSGTVITVVVAVLIVTGFYVVPPKKGDV